VAPPGILYEDADIVVVDKPAGLLVHRSAWSGGDGPSLARMLSDRLGRQVFAVQRLDRGTSGALLFALSAEMARALQVVFEEGRIEKHYLALVRGAPPARVEVDHPVPRREGAERVAALTLVRTLETVTVEDSPLREKTYALVEASPRTGRFHQIRRHLKHLGHPVIGDANYGRAEHNRLLSERFGLSRLALHAAELELVHPETEERLRVVAPLPPDLRGPLERMGFALGS